MTLIKTKGFRRVFVPVAAVLCALIMTPDAEAMMGHTVFDGEPSQDQCRQCHGDNANQPHPRLQIVNTNRHHARLGQPIIGLAYGSHDTVAPGDISTGEYQCMSCHGVTNPQTQQIEPFFTTDCLDCHSASSVTGSPGMGTNVHHYTEAFSSRNCSSCHNFLSTEGSTNPDSSLDSGMHRRGR